MHVRPTATLADFVHRVASLRSSHIDPMQCLFTVDPRGVVLTWLPEWLPITPAHEASRLSNDLWGDLARGTMHALGWARY